MYIKINGDTKSIKLGTTNISKVYVGTNQVWPSETTGDNLITYDGVTYTMVDNIDPNQLCYKSDWRIDLKDGTQLTISNTTKVTSVILKSCDSSITTINNNFLYNCSSLTSVDLSGLTSVTTINGSFLSICTSLTSIDLSGLSSVTTISFGFLYNCSSLTSVDLSGLSSVTSIDAGFIDGSNKITKIDLSTLTSVTSIGSNFLRNSSFLTEITLFNKSPTTFTTSIYDFMKDVPTTIPMYCLAEYETDYKTTSPWSTRASQIQVKS